jgi:hypothetical protein
MCTNPQGISFYSQQISEIEKILQTPPSQLYISKREYEQAYSFIFMHEKKVLNN